MDVPVQLRETNILVCGAFITSSSWKAWIEACRPLKAAMRLVLLAVDVGFTLLGFNPLKDNLLAMTASLLLLLPTCLLRSIEIINCDNN
jgi:hypothetical protein